MTELDADLLVRLERARHLLVRGLARATGEDAPSLTGPQYLALATLAAADGAGPITMRTLARESGVAESTASRMVDSLERLGHVRRRPDPTDRRLVGVALTPGGDAALTAHAAAKRDQWQRALAPLPAAERARAVDLLERVGALLTDPPAKDQP